MPSESFVYLSCAVKTARIWVNEVKKWREVAQLCLTLCNPMDCSPPGSLVPGIFQARVLEWVAISFSRASSWPRDQTQVSDIAGRRFTLWATREAHTLNISQGSDRSYSFWVEKDDFPFSWVLWMNRNFPGRRVGRRKYQCQKWNGILKEPDLMFWKMSDVVPDQSIQESHCND